MQNDFVNVGRKGLTRLIDERNARTFAGRYQLFYYYTFAIA